MAVPKKKVSSARRDKRRSNNSKLEMPGMYVLAHHVCKACGSYDGKEVVKKDA